MRYISGLKVLEKNQKKNKKEKGIFIEESVFREISREGLIL